MKAVEATANAISGNYYDYTARKIGKARNALKAYYKERRQGL